MPPYTAPPPPLTAAAAERDQCSVERAIANLDKYAVVAVLEKLQESLAVMSYRIPGTSYVFACAARCRVLTSFDALGCPFVSCADGAEGEKQVFLLGRPTCFRRRRCGRTRTASSAKSPTTQPRQASLAPASKLRLIRVQASHKAHRAQYWRVKAAHRTRTRSSTPHPVSHNLS